MLIFKSKYLQFEISGEELIEERKVHTNRGDIYLSTSEVAMRECDV